MDNMTPNKIKRLIHLAEDGSFDMERRSLLAEEDVILISSHAAINRSAANYESSSGILDLDRVDAFGESGIGNVSLSKYAAFDPGELTGRSTGTEDPGITLPLTDDFSRYSLGVQSYTNNVVNVQTNEIQDIMRNSVATNCSFHTKPDLSADQASWIAREAALPVPQSTFVQIADASASVNNSNLSVGAYFQSRCPEFMRLLGKTDSPNKYNLRPSITEVSSYDIGKESNQVIVLDDTLDTEPVKQPRNYNTQKIPEQQPTSKSILNKNQNLRSATEYEARTAKGNTKTGVIPVQKSLMATSKPIDMLLKSVPNSLRPVTEDTEGEENSLSVSKIADYLGGKQSELRVSDIMQLNRKKPPQKKQPLTELHFNTQDKDLDVPVARLIDTLNIDSASSAGTTNTVISLDKYRIAERDTPNIILTKPSHSDIHHKRSSAKTARSKSPSSMNAKEAVKMGTSHSTAFNTEATKTTGVRLKSPSNSNRIATSTAEVVKETVARTKSPSNSNRIATSTAEVVKATVARTKSPSSIGRSTLMEAVKATEARSKSPSTSHSTGSTVRDNLTSFKFGDSPLRTSQGEVNRSKVPSPNIGYKELDKSVDWEEVLLHKRIGRQSLGKEQYADIVATPVDGFVGVRCAANITVAALTVGWLTAKFQFEELPNEGKDLQIELPPLPVLFNPGKSEQFTLHLTSNVEMDATLPFTMYFKDSYIDGELAHKGTLKVNFKLPVIQAMSADGMNKVSFPQAQEKSCLTKCFVIISNCPDDLQLDLSVSEGESMFSIKNVQGINKGDVNKALLERPRAAEEAAVAKCKPTNRLLCRLTSGNAISVTLMFSAPKLSELQLSDPMVTFSGVLKVNLIGIDTVLRKVDLLGVVGTVSLALDVPDNKLHVTREPTSLTVRNTGSFSGVWKIKFKTNEGPIPFKLSPARFELQPGASVTVTIAYTGPENSTSEAHIIVFEEISSGKKATLTVTGGSEKLKIFPIKTNHNEVSWVRTGIKEISLKNCTEGKVNLRCHIVGEGFSIGLPGGEARGTYCIKFTALERRRIPILFSANSFMPHSATLHLVCDRNSNFSRKVRLYGCASEAAARWSGRVVTCGHTALLRAAVRSPIDLLLYNPAAVPAFVCASVQFNLKYLSVSSECELIGARAVVGGRARHAVSLRVRGAGVERRLRESGAAALATVTVLTGAELTRRRILRILRDGSTGELDTSRLPDHLKVLADPFDGEDASMDSFFVDFNESEASLQELIDGLQELTAQIDLSNDFSDGNNTVLYAEDTVIDHHTLLE